MNKKNAPKKNKKRGKPKKKKVIRFLKMTNFNLPNSGNIIGWYEEEKTILPKLTLRHRWGKYDDYLSLPYLPFQSKK
eukprot:snap_masked-scaffold_64-processed-gene-0.32-mRNA-1 protein AED:1.00 eAED:1.00 QI:0/-1/0/0/-1/1/1/0/76